MEWPAHPPLVGVGGVSVLKKNEKKKKATKIPEKPIEQRKKENPKDIQLFAKTVTAPLKDRPAAPRVQFPVDLFGMEFFTFLLVEDMEYIISEAEVSSTVFVSTYGGISYMCIEFKLYFMVLISLIYFNFLRYLYQEMRDTMRRKLIFLNLVIVSKAGTTKPKLENRAQYIAERLINSRKVEYIFVSYNLG